MENGQPPPYLCQRTHAPCPTGAAALSQPSACRQQRGAAAYHGGAERHHPGADGKLRRLSRPSGSDRGPGIVVLQEIFGVNKVLRDIAMAWPRAAFRPGAGPVLAHQAGRRADRQKRPEWKEAFGLCSASISTRASATSRPRSIIAQDAGVNGRWGRWAIAGGQLAYLAAARTDSDATVGYYGIRIQDQLGRSGDIKRPLTLHIAEADEFTPPPAQAKIEETLKPNPKVTIFRYP